MILLIIYALVLILLVVAGILFYMRSVTSRKVYSCHKCGEVIQVELMEASHCSVCGTKINEYL